MNSFAQGALIGFAIAAPVGPIGLLCIRGTLERGRMQGFFCGLGAATADAVYGTIAAAGLAAVTTFLLGIQFWLKLLGGLFLLYLGWKSARAAAPSGVAVNTPTHEPRGALASGYFSIFALTLANPATILSFVAIFAGLSPSAPRAGSGRSFTMVGGVFLGSATWWLLLAVIAGWFRDKLTTRTFRLLNLLSGLIIGGMGLWQLYTLVRK